MASDTIFMRIGGFPAVSRLVLDFYERVLEAEGLAPWFADVDMRRLVDHQAKFISSLMGGPASYSDTDLREIHAHLEIDTASFDLMLSILRETLAEHAASAADLEAVMAELARRREFVVRSPA